MDKLEVANLLKKKFLFELSSCDGINDFSDSSTLKEEEQHSKFSNPSTLREEEEDFRLPNPDRRRITLQTLFWGKTNQQEKGIQLKHLS